MTDPTVLPSSTRSTPVPTVTVATVAASAKLEVQPKLEPVSANPPVNPPCSRSVIRARAPCNSHSASWATVTSTGDRQACRRLAGTTNDPTLVASEATLQVRLPLASSEREVPFLALVRRLGVRARSRTTCETRRASVVRISEDLGGDRRPLATR
jgi:hypothetical protein